MSNETEFDEKEIVLEDYDIAQLRKYASLQRVAITKEMKKTEIIEAIKAKMKDRDTVHLAEVGSLPRPGFARIMLHRDPTPGSANRPVYVQVNSYKCTVPRGVEVDVPIKVLNVLNDSIETRKEEDLSQPFNSPQRYRNIKVHSYPFQTIAITPGPDPRPDGAKQSNYGPRFKFMKMFGRWPKRFELMEAIKDGLIKLEPLEQLKASEFKKE